ncbi:MAG TPA: CHRD domain-containing protein [Chitinophagaceae bacterium]|nr:CHRD domain-containing protein [Chitinophagaceae bacterium]
MSRTIFSLLLAGSLLFAACDNDMDEQMYTTSGNASGSQHNPPVTTTATGTLNGTYNASTNVWQYTITWSGLSSAATIVEVRGPATIGVNGNLLFTLNITAPGVNGSASGSVTLSEQQEASLLADQLYYSVVSTAHVTGEIRGQILAEEE